ncbi:MAG: SGNH/GDSL hydrolase family protein [Saprospiraceae bacterium]|nr:SGNH/GDSL hydrolase family protein [Saprospiraceae bacterium]
MLLSAGGNDFFAVFPKMLKKNGTASNIKEWLGPNYKTELEVLSQYYIALLTEVIDKHPDLKIIIHGYDYIMPRPDGKWIGKPMVDIGINNHEEQKQLIKFVMDEFNSFLQKIALIPTLRNNVTYLDLRGTVPQDRRFWHDEIHPNDTGFEMVAKKFKDTITSLIS